MVESGDNLLDLERLRELREKKGWTQAQAAEKAGLSGAQQWSDIERGRYPGLSLTTLGRLAAALGVKPKSLLK
jgi:transcriptional regulator with XRE-family HTH domain